MIENFELHNGLWIDKQDICRSLKLDVSVCESIMSRGAGFKKRLQLG